MSRATPIDEWFGRMHSLNSSYVKFVYFDTPLYKAYMSLGYIEFIDNQEKTYSITELGMTVLEFREL